VTNAPSLWLGRHPLVVASKSEARRKLLQSAGLSLETVPASIDERGIEAASGTTDPGAVAALLARAKAQSVAEKMPGRLVLGADQTLAAGTDRFSKPSSREAAAAQLRKLSGRTHELHSAVAIASDGVIVFEHRAVARMTMRPLSDETIAAYLEDVGDVALSSVGAYQVEGPGIQLFERIDGDYFTILGLPLLPLLAYLRSQKLIVA
jgi:septum formation protein